MLPESFMRWLGLNNKAAPGNPGEMYSPEELLAAKQRQQKAIQDRKDADSYWERKDIYAPGELQAGADRQKQAISGNVPSDGGARIWPQQELDDGFRRAKASEGSEIRFWSPEELANSGNQLPSTVAAVKRSFDAPPPIEPNEAMGNFLKGRKRSPVTSYPGTSATPGQLDFFPPPVFSRSIQGAGSPADEDELGGGKLTTFDTAFGGGNTVAPNRMPQPMLENVGIRTGNLPTQATGIRSPMEVSAFIHQPQRADADFRRYIGQTSPVQRVTEQVAAVKRPFDTMQINSPAGSRTAQFNQDGTTTPPREDDLTKVMREFQQNRDKQEVFTPASDTMLYGRGGGMPTGEPSTNRQASATEGPTEEAAAQTAAQTPAQRLAPQPGSAPQNMFQQILGGKLPIPEDVAKYVSRSGQTGRLPATEAMARGEVYGPPQLPRMSPPIQQPAAAQAAANPLVPKSAPEVQQAQAAPSPAGKINITYGGLPPRELSQQEQREKTVQDFVNKNTMPYLGQVISGAIDPAYEEQIAKRNAYLSGQKSQVASDVMRQYLQADEAKSGREFQASERAKQAELDRQSREYIAEQDRLSRKDQLRDLLLTDPNRTRDEVEDIMRYRDKLSRIGSPTGGRDASPAPSSGTAEASLPTPSKADFDAFLKGAVKEGKFDVNAAARFLANSERLRKGGAQDIVDKLLNSGSVTREQLQEQLGDAILNRMYESKTKNIGNMQFKMDEHGNQLIFPNAQYGRADQNYLGRVFRPSKNVYDFWPTWSDDTKNRYRSEAEALSPVMEALLKRPK